MRKVFELLAANPKMGRARHEIRLRLRSFYVDPFVIFYRSRRDGVYVLRIVHERRDVGTIIGLRR